MQAQAKMFPQSISDFMSVCYESFIYFNMPVRKVLIAEISMPSIKDVETETRNRILM